MIRINNLKLNLDQVTNKEKELANLKRLVILRYKIKPELIIDFSIKRKALDARHKDNIKYVYNIDVALKDEKQYLAKKIQNTSMSTIKEYTQVKSGDILLNNRPVIIGFGPSGIFSAYLLAKRGYKPIILERGLSVENRTLAWNEFLKTREFKENASILFGEGGAGTFSDGKLTTLINDNRCDYVLNTLVNAGADKEILYINKPHIGTDVLKNIVKNIREEIIELGGEILFDSKVTDFIIEDDKLISVVINNELVIDTEVCLIGIGHSARDTFKLLYDKGIRFEQKPFSIGVRIEHPQKLINEAQYGKYANHPSLGAADYKLSYHSTNGRSAYTFCMCPGGYVVCSSSEDNGVVTNGMSLSKRDNINANSALLVNVLTKDFNSTHPLAGIAYQKQYEELAFILAGANYNAPTQLVKDFLNDIKTEKYGEIEPTYKPGTSFVKLSEILPDFVTETLKEAIPYFDKKIKGFANGEAILTGVETRSSSPVRIVRDEAHQTNILGLYSMGEGAGYAGGIMSSAVDGIKTAEIIIKEYKSSK
jgi:uncharacterized protein